MNVGSNKSAAEATAKSGDNIAVTADNVTEPQLLIIRNKISAD